MQGVEELADFSLALVIVDDANTARAWIEQVQPRLGGVPLVMVSSAQVAPLVRPYFQTDPRQVSGMVAGLAGGVAYERITGRSLLARAYWDAFGNGIIIAVLLILIGGAFSFALVLLQPDKQKKPGRPHEPR